MERVHIWPPKTGIRDLPQERSRLELRSMAVLREAWAERRAALAESAALRVFQEQVEREWAIETGQIENLYDIERGVTVTLIEQGFQAAVLERGSVNKPPEQVLALLNDQKDALQGLFDFVKHDRALTVGYIKELHAAMTRSQASTIAYDAAGSPVELELVHGDWKRTENFPMRNGTQFLYCPVDHTASEMERLVQFHHMHHAVAPEAEAAWLHHRFTQIHPFQDGNGRVARALATLVLIRAGMFPFIVDRDEKGNYLDALEAADGGDLRPLVLFLARQQEREFRKLNYLASRLGAE